MRGIEWRTALGPNNSQPGEELHIQAEQDLADAEEELADVLEELAELEDQLGQRGQADLHREKAADEKKRAAAHLRDKIRSLKHQIAHRVRAR